MFFHFQIIQRTQIYNPFSLLRLWPLSSKLEKYSQSHSECQHCSQHAPVHVATFLHSVANYRQWMSKWLAASTSILQQLHSTSRVCNKFLFVRFSLVERRSNRNRHAVTWALIGAIELQTYLNFVTVKLRAKVPPLLQSALYTALTKKRQFLSLSTSMYHSCFSSTWICTASCASLPPTPSRRILILFSTQAFISIFHPPTLLSPPPFLPSYAKLIQPCKDIF